ncbi:MAG: HD domain-containing protein [Akkermansiaceae bacterium]|nr:HD domain-containing protein [Akkermansiaceae bacterium]
MSSTRKKARKKAGSKSPEPELLTAIHIGASSVSMLIAQRQAKSFKIVDFLEKPAALGSDIFSAGSISHETTELVVEIIQAFQEAIREVGLDPHKINRAAATNIVTEAENHERFINRIRVACGLRISPIDDGEMTRLIYLKTRRRLKDIPAMRRDSTLLVHVGPGNTRALLFKKGSITRYTSYRLGTHRTREAVDATNAEGSSLQRVIREHISSNLSQMRYDYSDEKINAMVIIGNELQSIGPAMIQSGTSCTVKKMAKLTAECADLSDVALVKRFRLDYQTAEALLPALEINLAIAETFGLQRVHIPSSGYEQGLLMDLLVSGELTGKLAVEVLRSAKILARRYQSDPSHGDHVRSICEFLFEQLKELHQLDEHDFLLLQVAAILHEVGTYVSPRAHHKHSEYLILNSEIFGLDRHDVTLIALIARYHRHSGPDLSHNRYAALDTASRIRVCKISAILRVADALERTHAQRVSQIKVRIQNGKLHIRLPGIADASVERLAMQSKGDLFEQIFGLAIVISDDQGSITSDN